MANYGKILGSEAFSKGTDYARQVGQQTRAIQTATHKQSMNAVDQVVQLASDAYKLYQSKKASGKMTDMLAASQGYEKSTQKELTMFGSIASKFQDNRTGKSAAYDKEGEKRKWSWKDVDYYKKGDESFSPEQMKEKTVQSMFSKIGDQYRKEGEESKMPSIQGANEETMGERERGEYLGKYKGPDIMKGESIFEKIGWGKDKESEPPVEVEPEVIEDAPAEEINEGGNDVSADVEALDTGENEVADVESVIPAVEYNKSGDHNNKISEAVGAPKGGLNDWLVSQGIKGKEAQMKWKKEKWIEING